MMQDSRHIYHGLLRRPSFHPSEFIGELCVLLRNDPYFFPAHLEALWFAEEEKDARLYKEQLCFFYEKLSEVSTSRSIQQKLSEKWTDLEVNMLNECIDLFLRSNYVSHKRKMFARVFRGILNNTIFPTTILSAYEPRYLQKVAHVNVRQLKKEINMLEPHWWQIDTRRNSDISHHQHTRSIVLRSCKNQNVTHTPIDGVHESVAEKTATKVLQKTHNFVLSFAEEQNLALGAVNVVKLNPRSQVYRHYDVEPWHERRNRYHLVACTQGEDLLSSGDEIQLVREGEVWFFDNKVLHRSHNRSVVPRIHVVFDALPLKGGNKRNEN